MAQTISPALARRVALAAQGFGQKSREQVGTRALNALIARLGLLQIDSVNVFERSHYLPAFARLGGYDKATLDRLVFARSGKYLEYWAHEAAIIPVTDWPLLRWRMDDYRAAAANDHASWPAANQSMLAWLRAELAAHGPLMAGQIEHESHERRSPWWGWSDVKRGLETLFRWGEVVTAGRSRFQRTYALAEQVLPPEIASATIDRSDAVRELLRRAAVAHGIGTLADFADYYRITTAPARSAVRDLEDAGELIPVTVPGWERAGKAQHAWLHRDARLPRRIETTALLSPFDPVVWYRDRALRMFDFHYRIEIYTPQPKRVYGYYVLPVLVGDAIVGRLDLKSDRQAGLLRVQAAWLEPDAPTSVAEAVAPLLHRTALWQRLDHVVVADRGNFSSELKRVLAATRSDDLGEEAVS